MNSTKIVFRILNRFTAFALAGAAVGVFIGMLDGCILGAAIGAVGYAEPFTPDDNNMSGLPPGPPPSTVAAVLSNSLMGATLGTYTGALLGLCCGLLSFPIVALMQSARADMMAVFPEAASGAGRLSLLLGAVGAACGTILWFISSRFVALPEPFETYMEGYFFGAVAGITVGFFAGAILGGTGRLEHFSLRAAREWMFPKHL